MIDYSKFSLSNRFYTGTEKKIGILIKEKPYFVKFRKTKTILQNNYSAKI